MVEGMKLKVPNVSFEKIKSWKYFDKFIFGASLIILFGIVLKWSIPDVIKVRIVQKTLESLEVSVSGAVDADVSGSVDTDMIFPSSIDVDVKSASYDPIYMKISQ